MHLHSPCRLAALRLAQQLCSLDQPEIQSLHVNGHSVIASIQYLNSWYINTGLGVADIDTHTYGAMPAASS